MEPVTTFPSVVRVYDTVVGPFVGVPEVGPGLKFQKWKGSIPKYSHMLDGTL